MTPDSTLGDFFRADVDIPEIPFGEMLWETAQRFPEKEAVIFQGKKISYRELDALTNCFANALSGLGVAKGDRVALYMTNRPEYIIGFYATARLGAVATPMNPTYKKDEIQHQLNDAEASLMVVQESLYPLVKTVRSKVASLKEVVIVGHNPQPNTHLFRDLIRSASPKHPPQVAWNWTEDLVALPYSSGTTGLPKGVMLSQQNLVVQQHPVHLQRPHIRARYTAHFSALLPHLRHDARGWGHLRRRHAGHHGSLRSGAFPGPGAESRRDVVLRRAAHHGCPR